MSGEKQIDYETLVKAMREYPFLFPQFCTKDTITCKISLWNEIADIIEDLAGYRKQSENVIELPCKVGETIYLPWDFCGVKSIAYLTVTHIIFDREHNYVKTDFSTDDEAYYDKYKCGRYEFEDFGKIVFLTIEEARKALAKMKGGAE